MLYGAHVATAGKFLTTPQRAAEMGANTLQIFASNPRGWRPTVYTPDEGAQFQQACQEAGIQKTFIHMIYLTSYGTPNEELRDKSITALRHTLKMGDLLGVAGVVTHLGSHKGLGLEQALERLADGLMKSLSDSQDCLVLIENSAGAGGNIGSSIDELAQILHATDDHNRVKVCLDTAHLFASGYNIRTPQGWDELVNEVDAKIGWDKVVVLHCNDSKVDLGAKVDRHENIGHGFIGEDGFRAILTHPKLKNSDLPLILEVPGMDGTGPDKANLDKLKLLAG